MTDAGDAIFTSAGDRIELGETLGRGGEGSVVEVVGRPEVAAKIYDPPPNNLQRNKLRAMARLAGAELTRVAAWPTDTLHAGAPQRIVGFLMPRVRGAHPLHQLYSPTERQRLFPGAGWTFLVRAAVQLAAAFEVVHRCGHVVGDVNERNVLVAGDACVTLIDADSFQVNDHGEAYLCDVGVDLFTPPELQGRDIRGVQRTANNDAFGLAVLVFQTLFMGRHPFIGRYAGDDDMTPQRAIAESRFAFSRTAGLLDMAPPPFALRLDELPPDVAMLFERAFLPKTTAGAFRPPASQWVEQLSQLAGRIRTCRIEPAHEYWSELDHCPWCRIIDEGGPNFFASTHEPPHARSEDFSGETPGHETSGGSGGTSGGTSGGGELEQLWRQYRAFELPAYPLPAMSASVAAGMTPRPLPREVLRDVKWGRRLLVALLASLALAGGAGVMWWFETFPYAGLAAVLGLNLAVVFAAMWSVIQINARATQEMRSRRQLYRNRSRTVNDFVHRWKSDEQAYQDAVQRWLDRAERLRDNFTAVRNTREQESHNIESARRQAQLDAFLRDFPVDAQAFADFTPAQLMLLRSYGVQTACDVTAEAIAQLPQREQALGESLMHWRVRLEGEFHFDPSKPTTSSVATRADLHFAQSAQQVLAELRLGLDELDKVRSDAAAHFARQHDAAHELWLDYSQAKVDSTIEL